MPIVHIPFQPLVKATQISDDLALLLKTSELSLPVVLRNVSGKSFHITGNVLTRKRSRMSLNVDGSCTTVCRCVLVSDTKYSELKYSPDRGQLVRTAAAEEGRSVQAVGPELEKVELPL